MNIKTKSLALQVCLIAVFGIFSCHTAQAEDYEGVVVGQNVYVRAAPSMNSDRLTKLNEPQRVTVTDTDDDWLAILPAPGCYSVISKRYVDVNPETKIGTVTGDGVNVRAAGSLKTKNFFVSQGRLNRGDKVRVIGKARDANGEWYVIKPPSMVKFYISSRYVKNAADYDRDKQAQPETATTQPGQTPVEVAEPVTSEKPTPVAPKEIQPVRKEVQTLQSIRKLEKDLMAESKKPVEQRDFQKIMDEAEKLDVPQSSRFWPVYNSLLSFAKDEIELAKQRQAASMLVSEALNPSTPAVAEKPASKGTPAGYDLRGILEVSELYSAGPGGQRFVVRDATTYRIHGYAQNTTGSVKLRRYVGKNVGLRGKPVLDKKLSLTIFEVDDVDVIGGAKPEVTEVVEFVEPAKPEPAAEAVSPVAEPEPVAPSASPELVMEPETATPAEPEVAKPTPTTPQPWSPDMIEPTPLVPPAPVTPVAVPEPIKTVEPAPIEKPEPVAPALIKIEPAPIEKSVTPVAVPEPVKPVMPAPIEKPEPVAPAPIKIEPAPIEKPVTPVAAPEPVKPVIPAPIEKPEPVAPAPIKLEPTPIKPITPVAKPVTPVTAEPPRPGPIKISPIKPDQVKLPAGKPKPLRPEPLKVTKPKQPVTVTPPVKPAKVTKPSPVKITPITPVIKPAAAKPVQPAVKEQLIEIEWD